MNETSESRDEHLIRRSTTTTKDDYQGGYETMLRKLSSGVIGLSLLTLAATGCGTATGAAVGAGSGAAIGAGTGYGAGKGALIGAGVGAAAGAIYDVTKKR
jgi:osmotically inducible lipoprotein OsmB